MIPTFQSIAQDRQRTVALRAGRGINRRARNLRLFHPEQPEGSVARLPMWRHFSPSGHPLDKGTVGQGQW